MVMNDMNLDACKLYSLSWSEFSSSLSVAAQNLRNKKDLIDVTVCAGGKNFSAHKLVLGAASPLLMELLKNTTCQHPILMLAGISASDLETILDFVYHGEINIDSEKLPSLLQAAQFLDIRALSPAALVLNSVQSPLPLFTAPIESTNADAKSSSNEKQNENETAKCETQISLQKRKRTTKCSDNCQETKTDSNCCNKSFSKFLKKSPEHEKSHEAGQKLLTQSKVNEPSVSPESTFTTEEKKIISDLPVNCKLCGVTIRQSRNLRRHIDQMHSKIKGQKSDDLKEKKSMIDKGKTVTPKSDVSNTSSFLDFSDDSFNQLTEEIFNYSTIPDTITNTNSFSNSPSVSSVTLIDSCLIEDVIPASQNTTTISTLAPSSTLLYSLSGGSVPPLSALLGDLCFHLPTTTTMTMTTSTAPIGDKKSPITNSNSNENLEYTNLEDECCSSSDNTQDMMTFKELDNQLLSACFCSSENE